MAVLTAVPPSLSLMFAMSAPVDTRSGRAKIVYAYGKWAVLMAVYIDWGWYFYWKKATAPSPLNLFALAWDMWMVSVMIIAIWFHKRSAQ
jgi:hypothetical protein